MPAKNDLFERAAAAAERVTEFRMDVVDKQALLKSARNRLKKAAAEARALKNQVWEALGGKPRKARKVRTATNPEPAPPKCWYQGCGKPSVAAVSDWEGKTWECCADHMVASGNRDVLKENTDASER